MKLTDDRIAVETIAPVNTNALGIVIRLEDERPTEGIVKAVGPGKRNRDGVIIPLVLQVGDRVMFKAGSGLAVNVNGTDLTIFKEEEILMVLDDEQDQ